MHVVWLSVLIFHDFLRFIFGESTNYATPHYAKFEVPLNLLFVTPEENQEFSAPVLCEEMKNKFKVKPVHSLVTSIPKLCSTVPWIPAAFPVQ